MAEEIADIPADILRACVWEIRLSGTERDDWFPTGGRIRAGALPILRRRQIRLQRLRQWQAELERQIKADAMPGALSPAEREELEALRHRLGLSLPNRSAESALGGRKGQAESLSKD